MRAGGAGSHGGYTDGPCNVWYSATRECAPARNQSPGPPDTTRTICTERGFRFSFVNGRPSRLPSFPPDCLRPPPSPRSAVLNPQSDILQRSINHPLSGAAYRTPDFLCQTRLHPTAHHRLCIGTK